MEQSNNRNIYSEHFQQLKPDCSKCFGLCCVALYFSKQDGFPADKKEGTPCTNLTGDFRCGIHHVLLSSGCKGCVAYDCFGAGQQVSQVTFQGQSWREVPSSSNIMFRVFFIMQQLLEISWYLTQALFFRLESPYREDVETELWQIDTIKQYSPKSFLEFDMAAYHEKAGNLFKEISKYVRRQEGRALHIDLDKQPYVRNDFMGKDLRKLELRCADLRGSYLSAANLQKMDLAGADFIGADLRNANLKGADLSKSIFLTQSQINAAKGDSATKLPYCLSRPAHWH